MPDRRTIRALRREPRISIGKHISVCSINKAARTLLGSKHVAIVVEDIDGVQQLSLVPVVVPNAVAIVDIYTPWPAHTGAPRISMSSVVDLLQTGHSYTFRWDDVRERLVMVEGKERTLAAKEEVGS